MKSPERIIQEMKAVMREKGYWKGKKKEKKRKVFAGFNYPKKKK